MTPDLHQRAMDLFNAAVELPPSSRHGYVSDRSRDDPDLSREVESLLAWHEEQPSSDALATGGSSRAPIPAILPHTIGPYEILGVQGIGATAVVYKAAEKHPPRIVALKVIEARRLHRGLAARAAREVSLLARLRHPGIAQIHAAGTAPLNGGEASWLAIEFVDGLPLTRFAEAWKLDLHQRIALLVQICTAIEYAHRTGVIHRDLKPGNIFVEDTPDGPRTKVLDFGIARLLEPDGSSSAHQSCAVEILGTLAYMSPEQMDADPHVDTRADVYALGAIGYELLSGRLPIEIVGLSPLRALRAVHEHVPPPLSLAEAGLSNDLAFIFAKALAKDRAERYDSVADLRSDLQAVLDHRPIRARPRSLAYVARKFVRRNPLLAGAASLCAVVMAGAGVAVSWALIETRDANRSYADQLQQATRSARFLVREVVGGLGAVAGTAPVRIAMLDRLREEIEKLRQGSTDDLEMLADHAAILTELSSALLPTLRKAESLELRLAAAEMYERIAAVSPDDVDARRRAHTAIVLVGDAHRARCDLDNARRCYAQAHDLCLTLTERFPDSASALDDLAWSHDRLGHDAMHVNMIDAAETHFTARLAINERLLTLAPGKATTLHGIVASEGLLADLAERRGDASGELLRRLHAEEVSRRLIVEHPDHALYMECRFLALRDLAAALAARHSCMEAAPLLDDAVQIAERLVRLDTSELHHLALYSDVLIRRVTLAVQMGDNRSTDRFASKLRRVAESPATAAVGPGAREYRLAQLNVALKAQVPRDDESN